MSNQPLKYASITNEIREKFIDLVEKQDIAIMDAADECGIKVSTAKYILKIWKVHGRIGKK